MPHRQILLGSNSARRKDILEFLGVPFAVKVSDFPEEDVHFEDFPTLDEYVLAIATGKSVTLTSQCPDAILICADTTVYLEGNVYNKPSDLDDARRMLQALRGKTHTVATAVIVLDTASMQRKEVVVKSAVTFRQFSDEQLEKYIATSEPLGKAGSYAIQMGARSFVENVQGSLSNIVGLPIEETAVLLTAFGVPISVDIPTLVRDHFTFHRVT